MDVEGQPTKKPTKTSTGDITIFQASIKFRGVYFQPFELPNFYREQFDNVLMRTMPQMGWGVTITSLDFHSFLIRSDNGNFKGESVVGGICFQFSKFKTRHIDANGIYVWSLGIDFALQGL
eukprot:UN34386